MPRKKPYWHPPRPRPNASWRASNQGKYRTAERRLPNACGSTPKGKLSIRSTCWCRARARRSSVTEKQVPSGIGWMTHAVLSRHPRLSFQTVTMAPTLSIITDDMSTHPILGEVQHSLAPSVKTTNRTGGRSSAANRHILGDTGVSFELHLRRTAGRRGRPTDDPATGEESAIRLSTVASPGSETAIFL